jgi:hypothetical protein
LGVGADNPLPVSSWCWVWRKQQRRYDAKLPNDANVNGLTFALPDFNHGKNFPLK